MKMTKIVQQENLKPQIPISVRNLVEFLFREGDIVEGKGAGTQVEAMQKGSKIHRMLQRRAGAGYHPEVPLKFALDYEDYQVALEGRADGIIYDEEDLTADAQVVIDEIKGVYLDVDLLQEPIRVHLAQAKCYGYIFATQHALKQITVQMTYCNMDTQDIRRFQENYTYEEIETWFLDVMKDYKKWTDFLFHQKMIRQQSILGLEFPFSYREGQKQLVSDVYRSIAREKILFAQAPTGTGKTLATIYPAVQAMGQQKGERIFYLTAKSATALVARDAFLLLQQQGYQGKTVVITAKDKMCFLEERKCTPEACPYAKGHYDRINDTVYDMLQQETMMDREVLLNWAKKRQVCPFELSLDVASWMDHIVCDYNYVFDPNVYLKRFFAEGIRGDHIFLVDEAHNLVDRARQMYSETLIKEEFLDIKKKVKPFSATLEKALEKCNRQLLSYKRECENMLLLEEIDAFAFALYNVATAMDKLLQRDIVLPEREDIVSFYFKVRNFLNLLEEWDERYRIYCDYDERDQFCLHLFCVDPSRLLQQRLDRANATVFFSATLLPVVYYKELLCGTKDVYAVYTETVFSKTQRTLLIGNDVTSKYTRRTKEEYDKFADYIWKIVKEKKGNYMVFCPSYKMMEAIYGSFLESHGTICDVLLQQSHMTEKRREEFLQEFEKQRDKSLLAFCVLGGVFSEGIDLTEEKLIGSIIVGVGLPQVGNQRELMRQYFDGTGRNGFDFAYRYPGMNKVIQAAGRVIRTSWDYGVIALLDERFARWEYKNIFPREWEDANLCNQKTVEDTVRKFWKGLEGRK